MANGFWISEVMLFRLVQSLKALRAIEVTVPGIVMEVRPLQPSKAEPPIEVSPSERVTEVSPVQSSKAELLIDLTLLDIDKEVILLH
jgi:hypothetical protein